MKKSHRLALIISGMSSLATLAREAARQMATAKDNFHEIQVKIKAAELQGEPRLGSSGGKRAKPRDWHNRIWKPNRKKKR